MNTRWISRADPFRVRRALSVYRLFGAALALSACSSEDPAPVTTQPSPSLPAPASGAVSPAPAAPGSGAGDAPTMQTGTPTASSPDGQQVTNLTLPEAQAAGGELAPAGSGGAPGAEAVAPSGCVGQAFAAADPTSPGPFQVSVDRNVGPLAGFLPDPVYADVQQRFNIYRPSNLDSSGSCHPILVWANGR
ncbi:MAG: hypothetical protein RL685_4652, partial [Pseudomonadota bacterium]